MKRAFRTALRAAFLPLAACAALPGAARGSGYEFEGVGARQVSRAGAATADSDDWTAVYWNPANVVRAAARGSEAGAEVFGGMAYARDSNSLSSVLGPFFSRQNISSPYILGAVGGIIPLGPRAALGVGFYTPLLQGVDFHDATPDGTVFDLKNSAGILTWGLCGSYALTESLSAGAGLNALYGRITSKTQLLVSGSPPAGLPAIPGDSLDSQFSGDGFGLEGAFGLRYDPLPALSLAGTYRTGGDIPLRGNATASSRFFPAEASRFRFSLNHPPTLDLGAAWRPDRLWTLTADFHQAFWRHFSSEIIFDSPGTLLASRPNTFQWQDAWKLRFGVRRKVGERHEVQAGFSYDKPAVDPGNVDLATTLDVPMYRFSAGFSRLWTRRFETTLGAIGGLGSRSAQGVSYRVSGFQLMAEARWLLGAR